MFFFNSTFPNYEFKTNGKINRIPEPEFGFEVEILSTQTLNHLCSMFACQADLVYTQDFRNPDHLPATSSEAFALFGDKLAKVT